MIHPGIGEEAPLEILDILEAAGADVSHTVIAHMDRTVFRDENVLRLARRGCYIEYDLFGVECSHSQVV
jgi:phosphotriesterase-related protein